MKAMKELCDKRGIRFYVSDAHFKELCPNSCSCGFPESFNYSRGQWSEALQIAKRNGVVQWRDISKDIEELHQYPYGSADGLNCNSTYNRARFYVMTLAEFLKYLSNNPQRGQSPYLMFEGVLIPIGKDDDGNAVYQYNPKESL